MKKKTTILRTPDELIEFVQKAKQYSHLACDTETEEFSDTKRLPWDLGLEGVGFYGDDPVLGKIQAYVPVSNLVWKKELLELFKTGKYIFHNAKFDLHVLSENGIDLLPEQVEDTLLLSWLLDENRNRHGLKILAADILHKKNVTKFTDVGIKPTEENLGLFRGELEMRTVEWEDEMGKYCIEDCENTWRLFQKFSKQLKEEDGLWDVYRKMEIPFVFVLKAMERKGIQMNLVYLQGLADSSEEELVELVAKVRELSKNPVMNLDSPKQVREALSSMGLNVPAKYKTPSGEISTNEAALRAISELGGAGAQEMGKSLLRYRELSKLRNTYMLGLQKQAKDGVIHTNFNHIGTVTGRLASSKPNLQNIPRRDDALDIRKAFTPRAGYVFVNADYSQLELRIAAYFSKDPTLLKAYETGEDVHQATADKLGVSRNVSKCFNADARLMGIREPINITDIAPAVNSGMHTPVTTKYDTILRDADDRNKVVGTYYEEGVKEWVEFELVNGDKIEVTPDHAMIVERDGKQVRCSAKDVLETDSLIEGYHYIP